VFVVMQRTAYDSGTGDWSSDVCSSDRNNDVFEARQTLAELTVKDVFEKSLQANLVIEKEEAITLTALFNQCLLEMEAFQQEHSPTMSQDHFHGQPQKQSQDALPGSIKNEEDQA